MGSAEKGFHRVGLITDFPHGVQDNLLRRPKVLRPPSHMPRLRDVDHVVRLPRTWAARFLRSLGRLTIGGAWGRRCRIDPRSVVAFATVTTLVRTFPAMSSTLAVVLVAAMVAVAPYG